MGDKELQAAAYENVREEAVKLPTADIHRLIAHLNEELGQRNYLELSRHQ
jgi:hypothetical protein